MCPRFMVDRVAIPFLLLLCSENFGVGLILIMSCVFRRFRGNKKKSEQSSCSLYPPTTTALPTPTNGIRTPTPTQPGMMPNCNKFYLFKSGDGCWAIVQQFHIALIDFYKWNPYINENPRECGNLWPDYYVYVQVIDGTTTSKPAPTTTSPYSD